MTVMFAEEGEAVSVTEARRKAGRKERGGDEHVHVGTINAARPLLWRHGTAVCVCVCVSTGQKKKWLTCASAVPGRSRQTLAGAHSTVFSVRMGVHLRGQRTVCKDRRRTSTMQIGGEALRVSVCMPKQRLTSSHYFETSSSRARACGSGHQFPFRVLLLFFHSVLHVDDGN